MHKVTRLLIRTDGTQQVLPGPVSSAEIHKLIGAECLDTVSLHHMGRPLHVMMIDDHGYDTEEVVDGHIFTMKPVRALKPVNVEATRLYHLNCQPGTVHQIVGDVVIVPDEDFA